MSTWKAAHSLEARTAPVASDDPVADARPPAPAVDVVSLALDAEEDPGSDPYNHTGSFLKPLIDEHSD